MRIDELLARGRTLSFELMAPNNEKRAHQIDEVLPTLEALKPDFVSVTYGAGGSTREGTHELVDRLLGEEVTTVAHVTTAGQSRAALRDILERYRDDGLQNILALRGDPPLGADASSDVGGELTRAVELVALARDVGDFCIGVAMHPDGHPDAPDHESDIKFQLEKISKADYGITQFFFDADRYFAFVEELAVLGNTKPIVPGLIAPVSVKQMERMAAMAGARVPSAVHERLLAHGDDEAAVEAAGEQIVVELAQKLLDGGAPGIHIYTLNHSRPAQLIFKALRA